MICVINNRSIARTTTKHRRVCSEWIAIHRQVLRLVASVIARAGRQQPRAEPARHLAATAAEPARAACQRQHAERHHSSSTRRFNLLAAARQSVQSSRLAAAAIDAHVGVPGEQWRQQLCAVFVAAVAVLAHRPAPEQHWLHWHAAAAACFAASFGGGA